jgi:hypothetical protein
MRVLYVICAVLVTGSLWVGLMANDAYKALTRAEVMNARIQKEYEDVQAQRAELEKAGAGPLLASPEALSVFYSRLLEAGEVLGAAVRIEPRNAAFGAQVLTFEDPGGGEVGLQVCRARLQAAMQGDDTIPVLSMVEEELQDLPVTVTGVEARLSGGDIALTVDVDIFGRVP